MRIFLDTANAQDIAKGEATGVITGVTTNPTIISRVKMPFDQCISQILAIDPKLTVLLEVIANETKGIFEEAGKLSEVGEYYCEDPDDSAGFGCGEGSFTA